MEVVIGTGNTGRVIAIRCVEADFEGFVFGLI